MDLPADFCVKSYKKLNPDLSIMPDRSAERHYCTIGAKEGRVYKEELPEDFNVNVYRELNSDISDQSDSWLKWHYLVYGKNEGRPYVSFNDSSVEWTNSSLTNEEKVKAWCSAPLTKTETILKSKQAKNAIVTFSSAERPYITKAKATHLNCIAARWNSDFVLVTDPSDLLTKEQIDFCLSFESFRPNILNYICKILCIYEALSKYDRVVWIDDTCIISPFAPSLFNIVPEDCLGALIVPRSCGLAESVSDYKYLLNNKQFELEDRYYNTGVMVIPSSMRSIFSFESVLSNKELFKSPYPTQAWQNYLTQFNGCKTYDITCMYNMMPCCLQYNNTNWGNDSIKDLYSKLLQYHIVHFTGFHRKRETFHAEFFELHQTVFDQNITVVIMNYKRPDNILNKILPYYESIPAINQIVIVNCLQSTSISCVSSKTKCVDEFNTNERYGVFTRFIAAQKYSKNDCILFTDDDVIIPSRTMSIVYQKWRENTLRVVGAEGRRLYKNVYSNELEYKPNLFYGEVDIVLTSCCMTSLKNVELACQHELLLRDYAEGTKTRWNGEDIYLSLLSKIHLNVQSYAVHAPITSLEEGQCAISSHRSHLIERTALLNLVADRFNAHGLFDPIPLACNLFVSEKTHASDIYVRCTEGFGNQLRIMLAGSYLVQHGYISRYTQEWVLNNENNVNFLEYFEPLPGVTIAFCDGNRTLIKASTFQGLIKEYAPSVNWKEALQWSLQHLQPLPHIQEEVDRFVCKHDIKNCIGIHARRTCKLQLLAEEINNNRSNPISNEKILELASPYSKIFLATDNKQTQCYFKKQFNSKLIVADNITNGNEISQSSKIERFTSKKHTILDFLILKHCNYFVGSSESSFSSLIFYWRNNKKDFYLFGKI
jgi:hypothetical protein